MIYEFHFRSSLQVPFQEFFTSSKNYNNSTQLSYHRVHLVPCRPYFIFHIGIHLKRRKEDFKNKQNTLTSHMELSFWSLSFCLYITDQMSQGSQLKSNYYCPNLNVAVTHWPRVGIKLLKTRTSGDVGLFQPDLGKFGVLPILLDGNGCAKSADNEVLMWI